MNITTPLIIAIALIALIWVFIELKRFKHKILAIFLIALVISAYFSFTFVLKKENPDLSTIGGIKNSVSLYFSWLGNLFSNFKTITSNAVNLEWNSVNETNSTEKG